MEPVDRVIVELVAKLDRYEANVARAESKFTKSMQGIQKSAGATEAFVARAAGVMSGALAGVSVLALARGFLTLADEAKKLDAQLRLATAGFGSFGQAQEDVRRIADETRSGLSETASLYGNFVRGAKELGASQAEAARATETFSKTLKISGADANQAASATLQFGQALASGALRGDELNSILEASPRLARLLADAMGQPIGQIKKLGEEGLLTSDKLLRALTDTKFTAGIDAEFREIPVTFDEAMTKVYNAAVITFGAFDRGGEFSTMLANFVSDGADGFTDLEARAEQFGIEVRSTLAGLGDVFDPLLNAGVAVFDALGLKAFDLQGFIKQSLREFDAITGYLANTPGGRLLGVSGSNLLGRYEAGQGNKERTLQGQAAERRFRNLIGGYDVLGNPIAGTPAAGPGTPPRPVASSSGGKKKPPAVPKSKLSPEAFAREEASLNDDILRYKGEEVVGIAAKAQAEADRIEAARKVAAAEIANDERFTAVQKERLTALTATVAALQSAAVVAERDKVLAEQVAEARRGNARYERDALEAQAQGAETRQARLEAERRILDFLEQQERAELEAAIQAGRIADANKARADLASAQGSRRGAVERDGAGPLARRARELETTDIGYEVERYAVEELQHFQDGLRNAITKKLGIKDPFLASLLDLFIQQNIIKPLAQALDGANGGGGGDTGAAIVAGARAIFGFSGGGSGTIGGMGGTDTNTLSLNGQPFANVSRGETLSIGSKALNSRSSATIVQPIIQVDARGAVMNDQFATMILREANQTAASMVQAGGRAINANIPNRIAQFQRDGT